MLSYLGFAVAAVLGGVVLVQRAEMRRAQWNWADVQADLDALNEAVEARNETAAVRLCGRNSAREKFVRPPVS